MTGDCTSGDKSTMMTDYDGAGAADDDGT